MDATFLAVRPDGPKEGVLIAWGFAEQGQRVLLSVMLGMRESYEDWQALGRDLIARGLGAPMLVVADGAPGLTKAIEQCWPASDRQRCCVHRARNLYAKVPERERERVRRAYWQALDEAINERHAKQQLQALVDQLDVPATAPPPSASPTISTRSSCTCATRPGTAAGGAHKPGRTVARRGQTPHQGDRPVPRRGQLPHPRMGRPRPRHHQRDQRADSPNSTANSSTEPNTKTPSRPSPRR